MEMIKESETLLTFPTRDRELDIFFSDVPTLAADDGGHLIRKIKRDRLVELHMKAARLKEPLARKLGLGPDGRRWITLPDRDWNAVKRETTGNRAAEVLYEFINAFQYLSKSELRRDTVADCIANIEDAAHRAKIERLWAAWLKEYGKPETDPDYSAPYLAMRRIKSLLDRTELYGRCDEYLDLISTWPLTMPDITGKPRTIRTARWFKKYQPLLTFTQYYHLVDENVDQIFSVIADILARSNAEVCISVNPMDFLLSASRGPCDFTSCHSLDGMHSHGNVAYVNDGHTALIFLTRRRTDGYPFKKVARCWLYIGDRDQIIMGKLYGRAATASMTGDVMRQIEQMLRPNERWRFRNDVQVDWGMLDNIGGHGSCDGHMNYAGFFDDPVHRMAVPVAVLESMAEPASEETAADEEDEVEVERRAIRLKSAWPYLRFGAAICLHCGDYIERHEDDGGYDDRTNSPFCGECNKIEQCTEPGCGEWSDNYRTAHDGRVVCRDCFEDRYVTCQSCSCAAPSDTVEVVLRGRETWNATYQTYTPQMSEVMYCEPCVQNYTQTCVSCDERFNRGDYGRQAIRVADGDHATICPHCYAFATVSCVRTQRLHLTEYPCPDPDCAPAAPVAPATTEETVNA